MPEPDLSALGGGTPTEAAPASAPDISGGYHVTKPPPPLPDEPDASLLARAAIAEGGKDPAGQQAVIQALLTRQQESGKPIRALLSEPGQIQTYWNGRLQGVDTTSPAFQGALKFAQTAKPSPGIDSWYSPAGIKAQGFGKPPFDPSTGVSIGGQLFGKGYAAGAEPDLMALGGGPGGAVPAAHYEPGHGVGGPGQPGEAGPPDAQRLAFNFLAKNGFRDENAPLGSPSNPAGQVPGQGIPSEPNSWYVTPDGKLRQTGSNVDDYIPQYQQVLDLRSGVQKRLGPGLTAATGFGQGLIDVGQSVNKLTGGALGATGNMLTGGGFNLPQMAHQSLASDTNERNDYNLLFHGNPLAATGRFVGQAVPVTAATMGTGEGLAALGPTGEFLAGQGGGNLLTQGLSRASGGAIQGGQAAALTSSTSDRPLGEQLTAGALAGGALGVGAPLAAGAGQRLLMGSGVESGPITDLAATAMDKYGIPLRAGQIKGAAGDRAAAYADSNLLGTSAKFAENNNQQRAAFMRAVTGSYGDASGDVSPSALQTSRERIGGVMNDVASRTDIADADAVQARIGQVISDAQKVLPDNEVKPLLNLAENIGSVRGTIGISGGAYQALTRSGGPLDRLVQSADPNVSHYAGQMREALDDGLVNSAAPEDVAALQNARWQYKNLMTVAKLAQQGKVDANGFISPPLLRGAVATNFKNQAFQGAGDLGELAQIGQTFMKEPPQSGTVPRAKEAIGPLGLTVGAAGELGALALHDPQLAIGTAAGVLGTAAAKKALQAVKEARLGPGAANRLLNNAPLPVNGPIPPYLLPASALAGKNLLLAPQP